MGGCVFFCCCFVVVVVFSFFTSLTVCELREFVVLFQNCKFKRFDCFPLMIHREDKKASMRDRTYFVFYQEQNLGRNLALK